MSLSCKGSQALALATIVVLILHIETEEVRLDLFIMNSVLGVKS